MVVSELAERLNLKVLTGSAGLDREVTGGYVCDLLSWVMSHAEKGHAWITVHTHLNVVAVALLTEVSCIIIPEEISVDEATIKKAQEEEIPVLSTAMSAFELSWKIHNLF